MEEQKLLNLKRQRAKQRVRAKIFGTEERPRLSVWRSNKKVYAQLIDDALGVTLASASGSDPKKVGEAIAKQALAKNIHQAVFDKGYYKFHGQIKTLCESARANGLKI